VFAGVAAMKNLSSALLLGLLPVVAGLCLFFSPYGQKLEEDFGLALLFKIRGSRPPPENIVIINLDQISSLQMGLPENFSKWPRTVHARLVDFLKDKGAAVIAFDVHFVEARNLEDDRAFAESIRQAGNVVLFEKIQRKSVALSREDSAAGFLEMDLLIPPLPLLAESALALAPFPLPKLPVRVNQAWIFKTSSGDQPTLPAAALQVLGLKYYEKLRQMVNEEVQSDGLLLLPAPGEVSSAKGFQQFGQRMRALFTQRPELAGHLLSRIATDLSSHFSTEERKVLQAVVRMFAGANSIYLNYYGPPATLPTYSYYELLAEASQPGLMSYSAVEFKDKVVFVGASRRTWAGQMDGFYTIFSQPDGLDLSGVELAATAFANLYENKPVRPLSPEMNLALLILSGFTVTLFCWLASPAVAAVLLAVFSLCFLGTSRFYFSAYGTWPPLITPLGFQTFIAFLASLYWKYFRAGRERENIKKALGFYLPEKAVNALSKDLSFVRKGDQMVYSVCLLTDAWNYTTLSEKMDPRDLSILMKEYYSYLFGPVNMTGGVVSDVVGDSMLALWPSTNPLPALRKSGCQAALQIVEAVEEFNRKHPHAILQTRIGLHFGYMLIGNIGAGSHFEYAPIGDIVNTVSRIEGLNKYLGTNILATEEVVAELKEIATRNMGNFLLPGKSKPVGIHELLILRGGILEKEQEALCKLFSRGLACFTAENVRVCATRGGARRQDRHAHILQ